MHIYNIYTGLQFNVHTSVYVSTLAYPSPAEYYISINVTLLDKE